MRLTLSIFFKNSKIFRIFLEGAMKQSGFLFLAMVFVLFLCACGGSSGEKADNDIQPDSDNVGPVVPDADDTEPDDTAADDSDDPAADEPDDDASPDSETSDDVQTGGIYIFSDFEGEVSTAEILGHGGFFGFTLLPLNERYWGVSALHESFPSYDFNNATGALHIFEKGAPVNSIDDAKFVLTHPDMLLQAGFGMSFAACDINGDGFDDIVVSAHLAENNGLYASGQVIAFYGDESGWSSENSSVSTLSSAYQQKADSLGQSLACLDYDGDGFDDVFAGGQNAGPELHGGGSPGMAAHFAGSPEGLSEHETWVLLPELSEKMQYFGSNMAKSDINGDGRPDLLIGGWGLKSDSYASNGGGIYIYLSGSDWQSGADVKLYGVEGSQFGTALKVVEIAGQKYIGTVAPSEGERGTVHLFPTSDIEHRVDIQLDQLPELGDSPASDFDIVKISDGREMIVIGGKYFAGGGALVCAEFGEDGFAAPQLCPWQPEEASGGFGYSVSNLGDIDGSGKESLVVGKPEYIHSF